MESLETKNSRSAVSIRIKHRSMSQSKNQRYHDIRYGPLPYYIDEERIPLNSIVIKPKTEGALRDECLKRRGQRTSVRGLKSDAAISTIGIITFSKVAQKTVEAMTPAEQDALFLETAKKVADELGTDLTGLVVHRDETALHAHFQCTAVRFDGRPVSKGATKVKTSKLQDIAGEVWSPHGIFRGKKKQQRIKDGEPASAIYNRSVKQLHEDLPAEIEAVRAELEEAKAKMEVQKRRIEETERKLAESLVSEARATKRIQDYERRAKAAEERAEAAEARLKQFPLPKPIKLRQVVNEEQRFFGILPPKIETLDVSAFRKDEVKTWAEGQAVEVIEKLEQLDQREVELNKRESALNQREALIQSNTDELVEIRDELQSIGRKLADDPEAIDRFGAGIVASEIRSGAEQVLFERQESKSQDVRPDLKNGINLS